MEPGAQLITHLYIEWEISLTERAYEATHEELQVHDGCPEHEHGIVWSASLNPHLWRLRRALNTGAVHSVYDLCVFSSLESSNRATPVGAIAMYTANLNSLVPETLKKCSCLLSYHFLLVRYAKMCILMVAILKHPIGPPIVNAIVIHISELGSLVPKTPEKWSCLLFYDYLLASNVKMCFLMAAILNRPIWRPHWKSALAPGRFESSRSKCIYVPNLMLLYKFAHSIP